MLPASTAGGGLLSGDPTWGRLLVKLPLKHPSKASKGAGDIELEVCYRPSTRQGQPRMLGPVRFRQHLSPNAGLLTGGGNRRGQGMGACCFAVRSCRTVLGARGVCISLLA